MLNYLPPLSDFVQFCWTPPTPLKSDIIYGRSRRWKNCPVDGNDTTVYQQWCNSCPNLTDCIYFGSDGEGFFLQFIVNIFYGWRNFYTKRNLIDSSLAIILDVSYQRIVRYVCYLGTAMKMVM